MPHIYDQGGALARRPRRGVPMNVLLAPPNQYNYRCLAAAWHRPFSLQDSI